VRFGRYDWGTARRHLVVVAPLPNLSCPSGGV
jgi:hypothetical protein